VAASPIRRSPRREVRPTDQPPEGATHKDAKPVLSFTAKRRGKAPSHLADLDAAGRKQVLKDLGLPAFRADQLSRHYFTHFEADPERMSDIPAGMRAQVREALLPTLVSKVVSLEADGGRTMKDLWRLYDGAQVESVLMRYPQRTTLCVSSQAGCGMACPVCARAVTAGTVYIMPSGSAYHRDPACRAIRAYVRAVRLSEVRSLGPCSYCYR